MIQAKSVLLLTVLAAGIASSAAPAAAGPAPLPTAATPFAMPLAMPLAPAPAPQNGEGCLGPGWCGGCESDSVTATTVTLPMDTLGLPAPMQPPWGPEDFEVEAFDTMGGTRELRMVRIDGRLVMGDGDGVDACDSNTWVNPAFVQISNTGNDCPVPTSFEFIFEPSITFPAGNPLVSVDLEKSATFLVPALLSGGVACQSYNSTDDFEDLIDVGDSLYFCDPDVLSEFESPVPGGTVMGTADASLWTQDPNGGCSWMDINWKFHTAVEVTVTYYFCPNRPPECRETQTMHVCEGETVRIPVSDVLYDPEYDMGMMNSGLDCSTVEVVPGTGPMNGTVRIESGCATPGSCPSCTGVGDCSDCYIVYMHDGGPTTMDSFEIRGWDVNGCGLDLPDGVGCLVQVQIYEEAGASVQGPIELCEDEPPYAFNPLDALDDVNDVDCSTLTYVGAPNPRLQQVVNGGANCGAHVWEYTPVGFIGTEFFDFEVRTPDLPNGEPGCTTRFRWRFTVNGRPAGNPPQFAGCASGPIPVFPFQGATDPEGMLDCSEILIDSLPALGVIPGATVGQWLPVTCPNPPGDCSTCRIDYLPNMGVSGADSFTYRIRDEFGCLSDPITANLLLRPAPIIPPQVFETCEGESRDFDVLSAVVHPAKRDLDCSSFLPVAMMTSQGGSVVGVGCSGTGNCGGCVARYTPPKGFTGVDSFTVTITDVWGCVSEPTVIDVFVSAYPNARDDEACTCPGESIEIDVLANDDDPDGFLRRCTLTLDGGPSVPGSSVQLIGDCSGPPDAGPADCSDCRFLYTPGPGFSGFDEFFYTVEDDTGCVSRARVVVEVQDRPLIVPPDDLVICVGGTDMCDPLEPLMFPLLENVIGEVDPSSIVVQGLQFGTLDIDPSTGMAVYTPNSDACNVTEVFSYTVASIADCHCRSDAAMVSIELNCAPIARDDIGLVSPLAPADPIDIFILENDSAPFSTLRCSSVAICDPPGDAGASALVMGCDNDSDCSTCHIQYTPPPDWDGEDSFTYRVANTENPECWSIATVIVRFSNDCEGVNRRMPGSLLLFPEYDQREGSMTMFVVTNVAHAGMGNVDVEIVYRDGESCLEFNRTWTMTPGDTRAFLTYVDNPHDGRGFAYAFAKCPETGEPIAYNELIGQSVVFDGVKSTSYSVNAAVFKGIGDAPSEGCPEYLRTDVDGDGLRDLDDIEYQQVPDQLIIPRFLGQSRTLQSELVILEMTGGAEFATTIDLLIFNDNEELFEADHTFTCWDKVRLEDISSVMTNDFLATQTLHDVSEILGATRQESGWILIDGALTISSTTTIEDPAVYGFLVECVNGSRCVADLPWELCLQDNGVLYPSGVDGNQ